MTITFDRIDFPYLEIPAAGLAVGLLPVCKAQFEFYLGDPAGPGREWYESVLAVNPRASWRTPSGGRPEELFLTGILPEEADRFARWLGSGYRLPTAAEWRTVDRELARSWSRDEPTSVRGNPLIHPAVRAIFHLITRMAQPTSWRGGALFDGGLLEWVGLPSGSHGLYGRPRSGLYKLLLNPQTHEPSRPRSLVRHRAFGFRLVHPLASPEPGP